MFNVEEVIPVDVELAVDVVDVLIKIWQIMEIHSTTAFLEGTDNMKKLKERNPMKEEDMVALMGILVVVIAVILATEKLQMVNDLDGYLNVIVGLVGG